MPASWLCWHSRATPAGSPAASRPAGGQTPRRGCALLHAVRGSPGRRADRRSSWAAADRRFAGPVQAGEQRQVDGKKALFHLLLLPALKSGGIRHPAGFHSPLQPLRPAVAADRQVAAGQLHQPQAFFRRRHLVTVLVMMMIVAMIVT
jgi:hypothetical protein